MIDLDHGLTCALRRGAWGEDQAVAAVAALGRQSDLVMAEFEPPDEEWVIFHDDRATQGMVSVRLPLALATADARRVLEQAAPEVVVVTITDFFAEDLRASAPLLRATVLTYDWNSSFDAEAFSANDLFVDSV